MPHRTTNHDRPTISLHAPWLVSLAMWENCMRFIGDQGITLHALERLARTPTNLHGMTRWGYVAVEPHNGLIRATPAGRNAQEIWRPLFGVIENRWKTRFGDDAFDRLRKSLLTLINQFDVALPDCLPILRYGLFSGVAEHDRPASPVRKQDDLSPLPLSALLSKALLAFALEFERESDLSLALSANVLRVLSEQGVPIRDLPPLTGVSREAIRMAMGILQKSHDAVIEPDPSRARSKLARLTPKGIKAQDAYRRLLGTVEKRWQKRFGSDAIGGLRTSLEPLVGDATADWSPLIRALAPYPRGWRASLPGPRVLPHFPMVLHRGAFPDGS